MPRTKLRAFRYRFGADTETRTFYANTRAEADLLAQAWGKRQRMGAARRTR